VLCNRYSVLPGLANLASSSTDEMLNEFILCVTRAVIFITVDESDDSMVVTVDETAQNREHSSDGWHLGPTAKSSGKNVIADVFRRADDSTEWRQYKSVAVGGSPERVNVNSETMPPFSTGFDANEAPESINRRQLKKFNDEAQSRGSELSQIFTRKQENLCEETRSRRQRLKGVFDSAGKPKASSTHGAYELQDHERENSANSQFLKSIGAKGSAGKNSIDTHAMNSPQEAAVAEKIVDTSLHTDAGAINAISEIAEYTDEESFKVQIFCGRRSLNTN
jgi:hypothetical protein